jgi:hypothetical protein
MKNWFTFGYLGLGSVMCVFFLVAVALGWETGWSFPKFKSASRPGYSSHRTYGGYHSSGRRSSSWGGGFYGGK